MHQHPVIKPSYQVVPVSGEGILLISEREVRVLNGTIYEVLIPLLDGRTGDEVVDALAGKIDAAKVYYALMTLERAGYTTERSSAHDKPEAAFWHLMSDAAQASGHGRTGHRVGLISVSPDWIPPLQEALAEIDVATLDLGPLGPEPAELPSCDLVVVLAEDYGQPGLKALNQTFLKQRQPWALAKLGGVEPWFGPLFRPGEAGCYACLHRRFERHQLARRFAADKLGVEGASVLPSAWTANSLALSSRTLALEIAKYLAGSRGACRLFGQVVSWDLTTLATREHKLRPDPDCALCGSPVEAASPGPLTLVNRPKTHVQDGGHRTVSPERTVALYQDLVSPITGAVRLLQSVGDADSSAFLYASGHNQALRHDSLISLKGHLRSNSGGKGATEAQAKAGALCEALERDSSVFRGGEYRVAKSFRQMGEDAIHPARCMLFSERQYQHRAEWNRPGVTFNRVPEPFDEDRVIDWSPVWSFTAGRHKWLPTKYIHLPGSREVAQENASLFPCSNGNASGNNLEEAVLQGFCELVERDAVALWWYNRLKRPGIDVASFNRPDVLDLVNFLHTQGRECWALDLTSDFGIPAIVALSRQRQGAHERILFGFGCHLSPGIALQRAFLEMNQMLAACQFLELEGPQAAALDRDTANWLRSATLDSCPYLAPDPTVPRKRMEDFPDLAQPDMLDDVRYCQAAVEAKGMEFMVHNFTRRDLGMPVVKVIVPGMRHFWARFAPGRLYDVPVSMGWLQAPLDEAQLNPVAMFI